MHYNPHGKRLLDFSLALILAGALLPVMAAVAVCIAFKDGRPVFFRQVRPGKRGRPFLLYKFRTMNQVRDRRGGLLPDGQRLTPLGRLLRELSLDELPQLFNVIKGEMSLVGPRPLRMRYLPRYSTRQARRMEVLPGITGWCQVRGRNALAWEQKFDLDVCYVDHLSLSLDMKILALTVEGVLARRGISQDGQATMPEFMGNQTVETKVDADS
ncbi:MAG: sugar transferase [Proteobacteria bacterium]|nr:sugar transferase [Pseudomonadota bacterium]MBU4384659.1 sugar transferase [Pseudomonadota bacterium]MCG2766194.1 sugar transferase [Desulfarculaceae bacterium]